jgi:hypothetical protein
MNRIVMTTEARAWVKRSPGTGELVRIVPDELDISSRILTYQLFSSYDENPEYLGMILFDAEGYWIYDGNKLKV